jgi:phage tail-like protein
MDVNGLRSFGLAWGQGLHGWAVDDAGVAVEPALGHRVTGVRLASRTAAGPLREDAASVDDVVLAPSVAVDALGNHLRWDGSALVSTSHLAARHGLAPQALALPPEAQPVTDLALGDDDVLYLAAPGAVWLADLRARFPLAQLAAPAGLAPQRLCAIPGGGVWVLDVGAGRLAAVHGLPPFTRAVHVGADRDHRLEACPPNPNPPRWQRLAAQVPAGERAVALATHRHGRLLVLSLLRPNGGMRLRLLLADGRLSLPLRLAGLRFAGTLGWLDGERVGVATQGTLTGDDGRARDPGVWTYALPPALLDRLAAASPEGATRLPDDLAAPLQPQGDYHPLAGWTGGPFAVGRPGDRLRYPAAAGASGAGSTGGAGSADGAGGDGSAGSGTGIVPRPVARVSLAARARYGVVANVVDGRAPGARVWAGPGLMDTRDAGTVWHRLYAEASVPTGCALLVWLATSDAGPPAFAPAEPGRRAHWHPHLIGERGALPPAVAAALPADLPRAAWVPQPTEVAHGQPVLCCAGDSAALAGRAGLFTVLIQRAGLAVRALQGARLWVAVELFGDGRATPELAALRAWSGRVSYRDRYLPAVYHERVFGSDADRAGPATGADFLDRSLHLFEGLFTDIEGRVAASALLTDPRACPPDALPWLAGWVGLALAPGLAPERARHMLANAPALAREHGTLAGLQRALDIATDGGVARGRLVVVEDYRLRRTLATLLGAQLVDADDPLTMGLAVSGNSVVGDTLFLGDAQTLDEGALKTFLALFRRLEGEGDGRAAARRALFDALAWRATVLVHETADDDEFGLVQRLAELGAPAHVQVRVVRATWPFMVGVASLVGADTYLRAAPPSRPVRTGPGAGTSSLGSVDTLRGEASLDVHAGAFDGVLPVQAGPVPPPQAAARVRDLEPDPDDPAAPSRTDGLRPFRLDGSGSSAAAGRELRTYHWTHFPPPPD